MTGPALPEDVSRIVSRYLLLVDTALPGQITGLYLVGSLALDDYRQGQSDIDFVAVTESPLTADGLDRLDRVHRSLLAAVPRPTFDGVYVARQDLLRDPGEIAQMPFTHEGRFSPSGGGSEANPSVWLTLQKYPLAVRGDPTPAVWCDLERVRAWNRANLRSYWIRILARERGFGRSSAALLSSAYLKKSISWCVPGVTRLHYTIAMGDVTSKAGACRYALESFQEQWHPILSEALALREGRHAPRRSKRVQRRDMLEYMEFVIEDALHVPVVAG